MHCGYLMIAAGQGEDTGGTNNSELVKGFGYLYILNNLPISNLIEVSNLSGNTTDQGGTSTFNMKLGGSPNSSVSLCLSTTAPTKSEIVIGGDVLAPTGFCTTAVMTYTSGNWSTNQVVTLKGLNDYVADGHTKYDINVEFISSDERFNGKTAKAATLYNVNSNGPGITFTPSRPNCVPFSNLNSASTCSSGSFITNATQVVTFSLTLNSKPTSDVSVCVLSSNTSIGSIYIGSESPNLGADSQCSQGRFLFTPSDWNIGQLVIIQKASSTGAYYISMSLYSSDTNYNIVNDPALTNFMQINGQ